MARDPHLRQLPVGVCLFCIIHHQCKWTSETCVGSAYRFNTSPAIKTQPAMHCRHPCCCLSHQTSITSPPQVDRSALTLIVCRQFTRFLAIRNAWRSNNLPHIIPYKTTIPYHTWVHLFCTTIPALDLNNIGLKRLKPST